VRGKTGFAGKTFDLPATPVRDELTGDRKIVGDVGDAGSASRSQAGFLALIAGTGCSIERDVALIGGGVDS